MHITIIFMNFDKLYTCVYVYYKIWKIKKYKSNQSILLSKTYQWLPVSLWINPESSAWAPEALAHLFSLLQNIPPPHSMSQTHVSCGPSVPTLQPSCSSLILHMCCFSLPRTSPPFLFSWMALTHFYRFHLKHQILRGPSLIPRYG